MNKRLRGDKFVLATGALAILASTVASCKDSQSQGTVVLTYQLWNRISDEPIDCDGADVATLEFVLYRTDADPIRRTAQCGVSADGKGKAEVSFPSGTYRELEVKMLRADGGPGCLGTLRKATWTFRNGESFVIPGPGRVVLEALRAEFDPGNLPTCGNGVREACEDCDDGNQTDGDGCSSSCEVEQSVCGNGVKEPGEECDDGNRTDGDGCSADCTTEQHQQSDAGEPDAGQSDAGQSDAGEPDASE